MNPFWRISGFRGNILKADWEMNEVEIEVL